MQFAIAARSDMGDLRRRFARDGHVSIDDFLVPDAAEELAAHLIARGDWIVLMNAGGNVYEIRLADFLAYSHAQRTELERLMHAAARNGFQFRYRAVRVADDAETRLRAGTLLDDFARFLNGPETLDFLRTVTGFDEVHFIDAQGTIYEAGDFLTSHNDDIPGKNRRAAYVFGLSRDWLADWGGLLLFTDSDRVQGFVPAFNSLRLFAVPRQHSVSHVSPWVERKRVSITGWLRTSP